MPSGASPTSPPLARSLCKANDATRGAADVRTLAPSAKISMQTRLQTAGLAQTLVAYNFIGGREFPAGASAFARRSPGNREDVVTLAPESTKDDVRTACEAARTAAE